MEYLPYPWNVIMGLASLLFAGGGLWSFLKARTKSKAADKKADTADWNSLMSYWQTEHAKHELRISALEIQHTYDERHINRLEAHIWAGLGPPPPPREPYPPFPTEESA